MARGVNYFDLYICVYKDDITKSKSVTYQHISFNSALSSGGSYSYGPGADYYSCNLGSNLVVHSHFIHLFLPLGHQSSQLLNVKAHAAISAWLQCLEFLTPASVYC